MIINGKKIRNNKNSNNDDDDNKNKDNISNKQTTREHHWQIRTLAQHSNCFTCFVFLSCSIINGHDSLALSSLVPSKTTTFSNLPPSLPLPLFQTLNKEQGIHWVKAERLPTFLNSDCYFEYRLAHVLSQVRLVDNKGRFVLTKVDYTPRPKKSKKKPEEVGRLR